MSEHNPLIAELRHEVDALRTQIDALTQELRAARQGQTMREARRCPACGCCRLAHVPSVMERTGSGFRKLALVNTVGQIFKDPSGELEVFVCTRCGLVEWYAKAPDRLRDEAGALRILDGTPPGGASPYR